MAGVSIAHSVGSEAGGKCYPISPAIATGPRLQAPLPKPLHCLFKLSANSLQFNNSCSSTSVAALWRRQSATTTRTSEADVVLWRIRRGFSDNVKNLVTRDRAFIDGWNERCHPFTWTNTADEMLPHAARKRDSGAGH